MCLEIKLSWNGTLCNGDPLNGNISRGGADAIRVEVEFVPLSKEKNNNTSNQDIAHFLISLVVWIHQIWINFNQTSIDVMKKPESTPVNLKSFLSDNEMNVNSP